jgi:hypothetical protein
MIILPRWDVRFSDHGLEQLYAEDYTEAEVKKYFLKNKRWKESSDFDENLKIKSHCLHYLRFGIGRKAGHSSSTWVPCATIIFVC